MAQFRLDLDVREIHQAILDTDWIDELDDDSTVDDVWEYIESLTDDKVLDYVEGDRTWVETTDAEVTEVTEA